jgi:hypothetical protein
MVEKLSKHSREASWEQILESSAPGQEGLESVGGPTPICASYMREERTQYRFMIAFQVLVLLLGVGALILLLVAIWQAIDGRTIATLVSAGGTVVTGAASTFLNTQRKDARDAFHAAQAGVEAKCG